MAEKTEGVLEMLDAMFDQLPAFREDDPPMSLVVQLKADRERGCKFIRDRVAELLAADEEYDEAKLAFRCLDAQVRFHGSPEWRAASIRLMHVTARRAAAIRAMRGEPPVG